MNRLATCAAAVAALVIVAPAFAADMARKMPVKAPPPPPAPVFSWTGWYVGGNVGGGWGHRDVTFAPNDPGASTFFSGAPPPAPSFKADGVVGGVQLGYNWQFNPTWVLGFETDFNGSGIKGSSAAADLAPLGTYFVDEHVNWFGTARARVGWLPSQNLLLYGTGGFAYGQVKHAGNWDFVPGAPGAPFEFGSNVSGFSFNCGIAADGGARPCFAGASRNIETGWTAGGGLEWAFAPQWSLRGEYLFVSLANKSLTEAALAGCCGLIPPPTIPASFNANFSRTDFNVVRVGLNYLFH